MGMALAEKNSRKKMELFKERLKSIIRKWRTKEMRLLREKEEGKKALVREAIKSFSVAPVRTSVFEAKRKETELLNIACAIRTRLRKQENSWESRAISRCILRKYKSDLLRENDLKEAALVDAWLDVENGQYNAPCSAIIYNAIVKPMLGEVVDQQVVDTNLEKLKKVLDVYESRLSQCKYLAGDVISFADLSHVPCTYCIMLTQYGSVFDSYPHVKAWWETIMARPSVRKVVEIMSA